MIKNIIADDLKSALKKIGAPEIDPVLEHPTNSAFGDYSTSTALKLTKILKKNPLTIAESILDNFPKRDQISKTEIIKPGFINFWISDTYLIKEVQKSAQGNFFFPQVHLGDNKKIIVEFAHPNTHKLFHIGHMRNISTGESIVRIFEAVGNKVIRANYQGDVGLHIAKCLYGIQSSKTDIKKLKNIQEKIEFIGKMYSAGTRAYEEDEKAKEKIIEINKMLYKKDQSIMDLWQETRQWSLDYFDAVYKRVDSHFDHFYFEGDLPERGIEIAEYALKKGILEKSQGAIVFNGKKYCLDTRVFINSLGFPTYEGKELALAEKEFSDFGLIDKCIHVVTPEQTSFFKVTFKVEELIDETKYKNKQYHLIYEWVKLKAGKMSSREGNIVEANWLIDQIKTKIKKQFKSDETTSEKLAIASVKYSFLKNSTQSVIAFDIDESISLNGNSGPYILYTYVRCQSVLKKENTGEFEKEINPEKLEKEELTLVRSIYQFGEIVEKSAHDFAPNIIANYLYDLASKYNLFYQKHQILKADAKTKNLRLLLTQAVGQIIKKGLYLLGIDTVEKM